MNYKKRQGFNLIEILVAIIIVGVLATATTVMINNSKQKGRDAKRVSDVKAIHTALEMYANDQGVYPDSIEVGQKIKAPNGTVYMEKVPFNPGPSDGECGFNQYQYTPSSGNKSYRLEFCLGGKVSDIGPNTVIANPAGFHNNSSECENDSDCPPEVAMNYFDIINKSLHIKNVYAFPQSSPVLNYCFNGACVECKVDGHCDGSITRNFFGIKPAHADIILINKNYCSPEHVCVECTLNQHCATGYTCNTTTYICE